MVASKRCSFSGVGVLFHTHYPRFRGAPFCSFSRPPTHRPSVDSGLWVGDYKNALEKARACADQLSGEALSDYRAWWYYLAGSSAALSAARDNSVHLRDTATELFNMACKAAPTLTWFREAVRFTDFAISNEPAEDPLLLVVSEAIEKRIQEVGISGARFERETQDMIARLDGTEATPFEQGLEQLGHWLGVDAVRPSGTGVPDGVWSFAGETVVAFEAKSNEQPTGPISLSTAREARGHINWVQSHMQGNGSTPVSTVVISDRMTIAADALPNAEELFVVNLAYLRQLARKVVDTVRALKAQASGINNEDFRREIAERLRENQLDPATIRTALLAFPLSQYPVGN